MNQEYILGENQLQYTVSELERMSPSERMFIDREKNPYSIKLYRTNIGNIVVSTAMTPMCFHLFETGILIDEKKGWDIVETYDLMKHAYEGHQEIVKQLLEKGEYTRE